MNKKIALVLCLIAILLTFSACDDTIYHWNFLQEYTEVKSIQIINSQHQVVKEIDVSLAEQVFEDVKQLNYKKYGWNLASTSSRCGYLFLITFQNDEYDLIGEYEPAHYVFYEQEQSILSGISWLKCVDSNQFTEMMREYIAI